MFQSRGHSRSAAPAASTAPAVKEKAKPINNGAFRRSQPLEREERMRLRESLERTFRARPITHYQPTVIHKATRPLTKPVSPMIGEKRKRYEMEQQYLEQQRQDEEHQEQQEHQQFGQSQNQHTEHYNDIIASPTKGSVPDQEIYRAFEEAKLLQARKQALQQQLTEQERRQVVLANSARATIHQPPIRLSFPMDPETEALQADEIQPSSHRHGGDFREYEALEQEPSSSAAMPEAASAADRSQPQPLPMSTQCEQCWLKEERRRSWSASRLLPIHEVSGTNWRPVDHFDWYKDSNDSDDHHSACLENCTYNDHDHNLSTSISSVSIHNIGSYTHVPSGSYSSIDNYNCSKYKYTSHHDL
ncbi:hypothetical protein BGZ97_012269 [Linnemannia gamsii]|uniref:TPX2 C-terminal domain-containing protein n=1 Tax=Linnemannia gamsii TaxID=64522 RepID=A0A9P6R220_9FUNG|nr:hypothetical protein BGZ97_012269 [Linnemannia gamsii]